MVTLSDIPEKRNNAVDDPFTDVDGWEMENNKKER